MLYPIGNSVTLETTAVNRFRPVVQGNWLRTPLTPGLVALIAPRPTSTTEVPRKPPTERSVFGVVRPTAGPAIGNRSGTIDLRGSESQRIFLVFERNDQERPGVPSAAKIAPSRDGPSHHHFSIIVVGTRGRAGLDSLLWASAPQRSLYCTAVADPVLRTIAFARARSGANASGHPERFRFRLMEMSGRAPRGCSL